MRDKDSRRIARWFLPSLLPLALASIVLAILLPSDEPSTAKEEREIKSCADNAHFPTTGQGSREYNFKEIQMPTTARRLAEATDILKLDPAGLEPKARKRIVRAIAKHHPHLTIE